MVKTRRKWFPNQVQRKERINPVDIAIVKVHGTMFGDETNGLPGKIAHALLLAKNSYLVDLLQQYIFGCCSWKKTSCTEGKQKYERLRSKVSRTIIKNVPFDRRVGNGREP